MRWTGFLALLLLFGSVSSFAYVEDQDPKDWCGYQDFDKIFQTNPATLSQKQFYEYEHAITVCFSNPNSGAFSLKEPQIKWLKDAVTAFEGRGIKLEDRSNRGVVYGDSYFELNKYQEAIKEYRRFGDNRGAEAIEWYANNKGVEGDAFKIVEYSGEIPCKGESQTISTEDKRYRFVSCSVKGLAYSHILLYRYDKTNKKHAVIFAPAGMYTKCDSLKWDGKNLTITLRSWESRDEPFIFEFDNDTGRLKEKIKVDENFYQEQNNEIKPVTSLDGKKIAFLHPSEKLFPLEINGEATWRRLVRWPQLWIKDADGKNEKMLVDATGIAYEPKYTENYYDVKAIEFSLDGKWIFFTRTLGTVGHAANSYLYRVPSDGSSPEKLVSYVWSKWLIPKGKYRGDFLIAHSEASMEDPRHEEYWIMDLDGKDILKLSRTASLSGMTEKEYDSIKLEVEGMK